MEEETDSGFIGETATADIFGTRITDVEILHVSTANVVARGRRYGRMWLLKGLSPELRDSTAGRHRLLKEFEIHSSLCHPSVAQAVNIEEVEGLGLCIVMEWVEGATLADMMREGKLSEKDRRRVMHDIIVAVEYIHRNGIVHRDLKPSNIMVRDAGRGVSIIDFGLADTDSHTELKQSAGTPGFISPEQLTNGGTDTADDIYSIGVIMSELCPEYRKIARLCTGPYKNRPTDAGALLELMHRHDTRKRNLIVAGVVVALLALGALATRHIILLGEASRQSESRVETLMSENKRHEEHVRLLSDSLNNVHSRMETAEKELNQTKAYTGLYDKLVTDGISLINGLLDRYDKTVFSHLAPDDYPARLNAILQLNEEKEQLISQFCRDTVKSGLKDSDRVRLNGELNNIYAIEFGKRYEKWYSPK